MDANSDDPTTSDKSGAGEFLSDAPERRTFESVFARLVATAGIVGVGTVLGAILRDGGARRDALALTATLTRPPTQFVGGPDLDQFERGQGAERADRRVIRTSACTSVLARSSSFF